MTEVLCPNPLCSHKGTDLIIFMGCDKMVCNCLNRMAEAMKADCEKNDKQFIGWTNTVQIIKLPKDELDEESYAVRPEPLRYEYRTKTGKGTWSIRVKKGTVAFNYCPFCGLNYDTGQPASSPIRAALISGLPGVREDENDTGKPAEAKS